MMAAAPRSEVTPEFKTFNNQFDRIRTAIANNINSVAAKAMAVGLLSPEQLTECTHIQITGYARADKFLQIIQARIQCNSKVLSTFIGILKQEPTHVEIAEELGMNNNYIHGCVYTKGA